MKLEHEIQKVAEELEADFEKLKEFEPNSVSKGFSKFTEDLCSDSRIFEPDPNLRDDFEIAKKELRDGVKNILLQIQEYKISNRVRKKPCLNLC